MIKPLYTDDDPLFQTTHDAFADDIQLQLRLLRAVAREAATFLTARPHAGQASPYAFSALSWAFSTAGGFGAAHSPAEPAWGFRAVASHLDRYDVKVIERHKRMLQACRSQPHVFGAPQSVEFINVTLVGWLNGEDMPPG